MLKNIVFFMFFSSFLRLTGLKNLDRRHPWTQRKLNKHDTDDRFQFLSDFFLMDVVSPRPIFEAAKKVDKNQLEQVFKASEASKSSQEASGAQAEPSLRVSPRGDPGWRSTAGSKFVFDKWLVEKVPRRVILYAPEGVDSHNCTEHKLKIGIEKSS